MDRRDFLRSTAAAGVVTLITPMGVWCSSRTSTSSPPFVNGFKTPPPSAKPFTWWHWINGNVTKDGITRDLEAMTEVGIGGFQAFSAYMDMPMGDADYMSPRWIELMQHAARESIRLGLQFDFHNCMGWSSSGGSWIPPELSMQQVVWSEAFVEGGKTVNVRLKQPFQRLGYYRDACVLAFPSILGERGPEQNQPQRITLDGKDIEVHVLSGFDLSSSITIESKKPSLLVYEFDRPVEVASMTLNASDIKPAGNGNGITLEASHDGQTFEAITTLDNLSRNSDIPSTACFARTKAKYFRLVIRMSMRLANVRLSASDGIRDWPEKANFPNTGYHPQIDLDAENVDGTLSDGAINPESVVDISKYMDDQGLLRWDAPAGHWTLIRFGHTATGVKNRPASGKGQGLECDKYSSEALDFHFNYMMEKLLPALKPLADQGKLGMLIDSYEVNLQNWTAKMPREFERRRGYAIYKYLPVLTGRAVGSVTTSERFLWDFRKTCADSMAENYQDRFVSLCRRHNIISSTEPYNHGPFDEMRAGEKMDINLGEFWLKTGHFSHSIKVASSIQNMNGRKIVAAESFTGRPFYSKWQEYPYSMKTQGDYMYTLGLNRFIFHRYAHQPHPSAVPGMTMGQWGFHFERTNTWFYPGRQWLAYVSRCQFMLQQGTFVGDIVCFSGEEAPGDDIAMGALYPDLPFGYDFQFANRDLLLNKVSISNGRITLPDGMNFRLLLLPEKNFMTLELARKLKTLVQQGMILVGPRPSTVPSLNEYSNSTRAFKAIVDELWGPADAHMTVDNFGAGRVFSNRPLQEVLEELELQPDFHFYSKSGDAPINYIHRKLDKGHVYFVANRRRFHEDLVCTFRVSGYEPELWDADTGNVIPIRLYDSSQETTTLPLHLDPGASVFVVFRSPASKNRLLSITRNGQSIASIHAATYSNREDTRHLANTFSVSLWVKPETYELMPTELGPYAETTRYTSSYPIFAPSGRKLFGEGHASFIFLAARNGVVVFEKESDDLTAVLIVLMPIASWTHFAVVYKDGQPSLYVNGTMVKQGQKSKCIVHPVIGERYKNDKLFYYDGDLTPPEVFGRAISAGQVSEIYQKGVPELSNGPGLEPASGETPALLYWQNGQYRLRNASGQTSDVTVKGIPQPRELAGEWMVNFQKDRGAPDQITLPKLASLHLHHDDGVKYFSGTATYCKTFNADAALTADGKRAFLDLGRIAVIAEIILNAKPIGILWKPPYRLDVTDVIKPGENDLQVKVTNLWPNRLIGDEQLPVENKFKKFGPKGAGIVDLPDWYRQGQPKPKGGRITFTTWRHYDENAPLLESGLIGPVVIRHAVVESI